MKAAASIILLVCLALPVFADKPDARSRVYSGSYDQIWEACVASAGENFIIENADKATGVLNFKEGPKNFLLVSYRVNMFIHQTDEGIRVQLKTYAKGHGDGGKVGIRLAGKFFKGIDRYLKDGKAKV